MSNKRISGTVEDVAIGGALILGYFLIVKPILDLAGGNPADKANIDSQVNQAPADDFLSLQYQPFVDNFNTNPSYNDDGSKMTMQQYFQIIKANNDAGNPILLNGVNIAQLGEDLKSYLSAWHLWTDPAKVLAVFDNLTNKTEVSSLAAYLYFNYGEDLLNKLRGSIFHTGLSQGDLSALITRLNGLPD